jgi:hypothetical protein
MIDQIFDQIFNNSLVFNWNLYKTASKQECKFYLYLCKKDMNLLWTILSTSSSHLVLSDVVTLDGLTKTAVIGNNALIHW